jgi:GT2 family glycosyltransferase
MMKKTMPTCSLIVTTYNWPEALNLSLRSVFKQTQMPDEIIVADDGSRQETRELIDAISKEFNFPIIHCWQEDIGFRLSRSRNNAIIASHCDYVIFIDGDVIVHKNFVRDHLKYSQRRTFVNGSRVLLSKSLSDNLLKGELKELGIRFLKEKNNINGLRIPFLHWLIKGPQNSIERIKGCNMAFWRADLIEVNGFDESFVGWGREDSDMAARLLNLGIKRFNLKFLAICYHLYHAQQSRDRLTKNDELLKEVIESKAIVAKKGLNELDR